MPAKTKAKSNTVETIDAAIQAVSKFRKKRAQSSGIERTGASGRYFAIEVYDHVSGKTFYFDVQPDRKVVYRGME